MRRFGGALGERDFRLWWLALLGMGISLQMIEVAIGWEVYALHRSPLDLGWIGLAEFVPLFVLALPAGQLADRVHFLDLPKVVFGLSDLADIAIDQHGAGDGTGGVA